MLKNATNANCYLLFNTSVLRFVYYMKNLVRENPEKKENKKNNTLKFDLTKNYKN